MKKKIHIATGILAASILFSAGILAQEKTEVSVVVKKDGKLIKDTTYLFEDASEAEHALKMMEILTGEDIHMEHSGENNTKAMVFISEDGEKTELREYKGDALEWTGEEEGKGPVVKKKEIRVRVSDDEEGSWTVIEGDEKLMDMDEKVYVIEGDDDMKTELLEILKEHDGKKDSNVKVIVLRKNADMEMDMDHEEEEDHDKEKDHEVEVEVKVIKKKQKKEYK